MEERLQKYMARCGVASRRKCEEIILQKRVKVNGMTIEELGTKININLDIVSVDNKEIYLEENKVYIALHKPVGYVTTVKDEKNRKTVIDLINISERIYPIGRLDYNTSGLLLLTNDGDIYNKIIHPRKSVDKMYIAVIEGKLSKYEIKNFEDGVDIGDYITAPSKISILEENKNTSKVQIVIHEGKNRQIRRMCEKIGHPVVSLERVKVGEILLGNLKCGTWRNLTTKELDYLKNL